MSSSDIWRAYILWSQWHTLYQSMAIISASDSGDGEIWAPTFIVNQLRQFLEFFRTVWTSLLRWQAYRIQSPPSMSDLARLFSLKRGFDRIKLDEDRTPLWVIIRRWPWPSWKVVAITGALRQCQTPNHFRLTQLSYLEHSRRLHRYPFYPH